MQESLPTPSLHLPSRQNPQTVCQTPNNYRNPPANRYFLVLHDPVLFMLHRGINRKLTPVPLFCLLLSFITPVVRRGPEASSSAVAPHRAGPVQQPFTPLNQAPCFQTPKVQCIPPFLSFLFFFFWQFNYRGTKPCFHERNTYPKLVFITLMQICQEQFRSDLS